jgi:hypothetical protein
LCVDSVATASSTASSSCALKASASAFMSVIASRNASAPPASASLGPFHTKRRRGGVERRQLKLKGVEGGD